MLEVKSTLEQRIKQLMLQNEPGFNALTLDATKQIANVSAVIKKPYDPNIIPEDIGRTRVNILTGNRRVSNGNTAISDRISTTSVAPTADIVGWTTDLVFTASDSDTVARAGPGGGAGSIKLADGTSLSINAGNTGNISAVTYVYYNGTTTLQTTTTPQTAVGANKIMVCVAKNSTSPALAQFQAFGTIGNGIFVTADNIAADAVTANAIAANSIDGMTITGAIIRTSASGQRVTLDTSLFRLYDTDAGYDSGNDTLCGLIYGQIINFGGLGLQPTTIVDTGSVLYVSSDAWVVLNSPYLYTGAIKVCPGYSNVNIGDAGTPYNNIYIQGVLDFDNGQGYLEEVSGYPRWSGGNYIPTCGTTSVNATVYVATSSGGSPTTQLKMIGQNVAGTTFYVLVKP